MRSKCEIASKAGLMTRPPQSRAGHQRQHRRDTKGLTCLCKWRQNSRQKNCLGPALKSSPDRIKVERPYEFPRNRLCDSDDELCGMKQVTARVLVCNGGWQKADASNTARTPGPRPGARGMAYDLGPQSRLDGDGHGDVLAVGAPCAARGPRASSAVYCPGVSSRHDVCCDLDI
jgi:hypothetical protein